MLNIPREFFNEEMRDGYLVSEMMKRAWAAQLEILESLKKIFDKYDLRYFADYGTLIGAIRHKGYIPWDDDIDLAMPREDFMKLIEHADEIEDGLTVRSIYNSATYMNFHAVVTQSADILKWDDERTERYHGCPFICYVDIFPWDYVPRDAQKRNLQRQIYNNLYSLMYELKDLETKLFNGRLLSLDDLGQAEHARTAEVQVFINRCNEAEKLLNVHLKSFRFDAHKELRHQLCIAADTIAQMCRKEDADYVDYFPSLVGDGESLPRMKRQWQEECVAYPFEFGSIMVPLEYEKVLISKYGHGYMTPVYFTSYHGYPFFRDEIRVLMNGDTGDILADAPIEEPSPEWIPPEIRQCLLDEDGGMKRVILYGLSGTDIINNGEKGLGVILTYLRKRAADESAVVFAIVPKGLDSFIEKCGLSMYQAYHNMIREISSMQNVILDNDPGSKLLWALISICDEYYGDICRLEEICRKYDVPVTIQQYQELLAGGSGQK